MVEFRPDTKVVILTVLELALSQESRHLEHLMVYGKIMQ